MGMFDYMKVERDIPGVPDAQAREWQTKDVLCDMTTVYLSADGRLLVDEGRYEQVPREQRPHPNGEGFDALRGCLRYVIDEPRKDWQMHGYIEFYDGEYEVTAKFTDGQVQSFCVHREP